MKVRSAAARLSAVVLSISLAAQAQFTPQNDPANLAGERVSAPNLADTLPINHGTPALQQLLRKLRTRASFMLIVAHPDDEDGGMLTYLSRGQGARVAMLTLTRGEGGQNLMSADFEDALGLIRTQELLSADRYMGVDQLFGTEVDFGFSKTKEEAFRKWTHERVLYDAVRAVRLYRPLVIGAVFIGAPSDGHGQHQVSGEIAQEVFKAAGDPSVFPDQIAAGLAPWQPLKVYARIPFARIDSKGMFDYATNQYVQPQFTNYVTGKVTSTAPKANVVVPEGSTDPLLGGLSYVQFARQGLGLQKSQIGRGGRPTPTGKFDVNYHRYGSMLHQPDGDDSGLESGGFFEGIDTSFAGIASLAPEAESKLRPGLQRIDDALAKAQQQFEPAKPEAIAPILHDCLAELDGVLAELQNSAVNDLPTNETFNLLHELRIKRTQLNNALALAAGLNLSASLGGNEASGNVLSDQKSLMINVEASNNSGENAELKGLAFTVEGTEIPANETRTIPARTSWRADRSVQNSGGFAPTRPYFSRSDIEQPFYDISDKNLRNAPLAPAPLRARAEIDYKGVPVVLEAAVAGTHIDQAQQPAVVIPPVSVVLSRRTQILLPSQRAVPVEMDVRPATVFRESASLKGPAGWKVERGSNLQIAPGKFYFTAESPAGPRSPVTLTGNLKYSDGKIYSEGYRTVGYPGIPSTNFYKPASVRVVPVDVVTAPNLKIAYIPGTGDDVPEALEQLGVKPQILKAAEITPEALKDYDAVVLGVRPYEANPDLRAANAALLAYAQGGGVVILQYVARDLPVGSSPYPLALGPAEKVVEEDAPVTLLDPTNPLLTWPNRITSADFNGWVEERGHGFMEKWDPHFTALTEVHDQGQQPQRGGLLVAPAGRGAYIYLAYALYRQLPEGVPGSYRILANLISARKNRRLLDAAR